MLWEGAERGGTLRDRLGLLSFGQQPQAGRLAKRV